MQYQLETINTNMQTWNEEEIKELILYAKSLQQEVDDKNAQLIMMNAKLENEEAKNRKLSNIIKLLYGQGTNPYNSN
jgi:septal ring factor EnvC (AmiA/AmiB activator)